MIVIESKLQEVLARSLTSGAHDNWDAGSCVMEAASYLAGEPWSDHPACVCPLIGAFLRSWNDGLPTDADRERLLKPLVSQIIDTKASAAVEERRAYLALDWLIRVFTPKWLDLVPSLRLHAKALRDLEEIADLAGAMAAGVKVRAARAAARGAAGDAAWDAAWGAAWAAAGDAAWDAAGAAARGAAWDAAGDAARAAAGDAAGAAAWDAVRGAAWDAAWAAAWAAAGDAAWDAAGDAARAAAGDAAGDAAGAAAWDVLQPTVEWLQASALQLVERMIAARGEP